MKRLFCIFLLAACVQTPLFSTCQEEEPWFAGAIIAFFAVNRAPGRYSFQHYLYLTRNYNFYDSNSNLTSKRNIHEYQYQLEFRAGLIENIGLEIEGEVTYLRNQGEEVFYYGDTDFYLGFQLVKNLKDSWVTNARILLGEIVPTGKYQNLNPIFQGLDGTGTGAFQTAFIFIAEKVFYNWPHPYNINLNLIYLLSSDVDVENSNFYGGRPGTKGRVRPGTRFNVDLAFEYKFNRNWGFATDIYYQQQNPSQFQQKTPNTPPAMLPSTESLSLTPSIEYNFNADFNIIVGSWFTVLGRNVDAFYTAFVSVFYEF